MSGTGDSQKRKKVSRQQIYHDIIVARGPWQSGALVQGTPNYGPGRYDLVTSSISYDAKRVHF